MRLIRTLDLDLLVRDDVQQRNTPRGKPIVWDYASDRQNQMVELVAISKVTNARPPLPNSIY